MLSKSDADLLWKDRGLYYQQDRYWWAQNDLPDGHRIFVHPFRGLLVGMSQKGVSCLHVNTCLYVGSSCPHSQGRLLLAMRTNMVLILSNYGKVMSGNIMKAYRGSRGIALRILNLSITWTWVVSLIICLFGHRERAVVTTE